MNLYLVLGGYIQYEMGSPSQIQQCNKVMIMHVLFQLPRYHQNSNSTHMNIIVKVITLTNSYYSVL